MDTGAALGGAGLFFSIAGIIYSAVNHKHIKSRCCGKVYDVSVDIGDTSPANTEPPRNEIVGNEKVAEPIATKHFGRKVVPFIV
jgi:hypothetical protein